MKKFFYICIMLFVVLITTATQTLLHAQTASVSQISQETKIAIGKLDVEGWKFIILSSYDLFDEEIFEEVDLDSLEIHGPIKEEEKDVGVIILYRKITKKERVEDSLLKEEYLDYDSWSDYYPFDEELEYDLYGNVIFSVISSNIFDKDFNENDQYIKSVVYIPPRFTKDNIPARTISLDLQPLGIDGILEDVVIKIPLKTVKLDGIPDYYSLYSNPDLCDRLQFDDVKPFIIGTRKAETLFGFEPGEMVKNICVNSDGDYYFFAFDYNCINLSILSDNAPEHDISQEVSAKHETFHLIDFSLSMSSDSVWQNKFEKLGPGVDFFGFELIEPNKFYQSLNESDFNLHGEIPTRFGHSGDDVYEFFASFLNSLTRFGWEEIMEEKGKDFTDKYKEMLIVLQDMVKSRKELKDTPISIVIDERMRWFEARK